MHTDSTTRRDTIDTIDLSRMSFLDDASATDDRSSTLCLKGTDGEGEAVKKGRQKRRRTKDLLRRFRQVYGLIHKKREFIEEECFVCLIVVSGNAPLRLFRI